MGKTVAAWLMVAGAIGAPSTGPRETVETAVVRVVEVLQQSDGPYATVRSKVVTQRKSEVGIDYRLHLRDSRWQVYDMLIDGVSFVSTYRSQFDRVIQAESYGALVERLRKRNLDTAGVDRKKL